MSLLLVALGSPASVWAQSHQSQGSNVDIGGFCQPGQVGVYRRGADGSDDVFCTEPGQPAEEFYYACRTYGCGMRTKRSIAPRAQEVPSPNLPLSTIGLRVTTIDGANFTWSIPNSARFNQADELPSPNFDPDDLIGIQDARIAVSCRKKEDGTVTTKTAFFSTDQHGFLSSLAAHPFRLVDEVVLPDEYCPGEFQGCDGATRGTAIIEEQDISKLESCSFHVWVDPALSKLSSGAPTGVLRSYSGSIDSIEGSFQTIVLTKALTENFYLNADGEVIGDDVVTIPAPCDTTTRLSVPAGTAFGQAPGGDATQPQTLSSDELRNFETSYKEAFTHIGSGDKVSALSVLGALSERLRTWRVETLVTSQKALLSQTDTRVAQIELSNPEAADSAATRNSFRQQLARQLFPFQDSNSNQVGDNPIEPFSGGCLTAVIADFTDSTPLDISEQVDGEVQVLEAFTTLEARYYWRSSCSSTDYIPAAPIGPTQIEGNGPGRNEAPWWVLSSEGWVLKNGDGGANQARNDPGDYLEPFSFGAANIDAFGGPAACVSLFVSDEVYSGLNDLARNPFMQIYNSDGRAHDMHNGRRTAVRPSKAFVLRSLTSGPNAGIKLSKGGVRGAWADRPAEWTGDELDVVWVEFNASRFRPLTPVNNDPHLSGHDGYFWQGIPPHGLSHHTPSNLTQTCPGLYGGGAGCKRCFMPCIENQDTGQILCGGDLCNSDVDGDGVDGCSDWCPNNPDIQTQDQDQCGNCTSHDNDDDGIFNCLDACPNNPLLQSPNGSCGCWYPGNNWQGRLSDNDGDDIPNCADLCPDPTDLPNNAGPSNECSCDELYNDTDGDNIVDCNDDCPNGENADGDDWDDCTDFCPFHYEPGSGNPDPSAHSCTCESFYTDTDGDGVVDCFDACPNNPSLTTPDEHCGCDYPNSSFPNDLDPGLADSDGDLIPNCKDVCPNNADFGNRDTDPFLCQDCDPDGDNVPDNGSDPVCDICPNEASKSDTAGVCGCEWPFVTDTNGDAILDLELDSDGDGTPDCIDECILDPTETIAGICGCCVLNPGDTGPEPNPDECHEQDSDFIPGIGGGTPDCIDQCDFDPLKDEPGLCNCHCSDDHDGDGDSDNDNNGQCDRPDADNDGIWDNFGSIDNPGVDSGCDYCNNEEIGESCNKNPGAANGSACGVFACVNECLFPPCFNSSDETEVQRCVDDPNSPDEDNDGIADCYDSCIEGTPCIGDPNTCGDTQGTLRCNGPNNDIPVCEVSEPSDLTDLDSDQLPDICDACDNRVEDTACDIIGEEPLCLDDRLLCPAGSDQPNYQQGYFSITAICTDIPGNGDSDNDGLCDQNDCEQTSADILGQSCDVISPEPDQCAQGTWQCEPGQPSAHCIALSGDQCAPSCEDDEDFGAPCRTTGASCNNGEYQCINNQLTCVEIEPCSAPTDRFIFSLDVADLNNDGSDDIGLSALFFFDNQERIMALNGSSGLTFPLASDLPLAITEVGTEMRSTDIDGDGLRDLVLAGRNNDRLVVLRNEGDFLFSSALSGVGLDRPLTLEPGDLNSDGRSDILFAVGQTLKLYQNAGQPWTGNLSDSFHQLNQNFSRNIDLIEGIVTSKIDDDDNLDIALAGKGCMLAMRGNGSEITQGAIFNSDDTGCLGGHHELQNAQDLDTASAIQAGDLNGDGLTDIIVSDSENHGVYVFLQCVEPFALPISGGPSGNPDSSTGNPTNVDSVSGVNAFRQVSPVDGSNLHGGRGLKASNMGSRQISMATDGASIGLGQSPCDFQFSQPIFYATQEDGAPQDLKLADINGDNHLDVIVANQRSSNVSILKGTGNSTDVFALFEGPNGSNSYDISTGTLIDGSPTGTAADNTDPFRISLGHLNEDEHIDIAIGNFSHGSISVLLGSGIFDSADPNSPILPDAQEQYPSRIIFPGDE